MSVACTETICVNDTLSKRVLVCISYDGFSVQISYITVNLSSSDAFSCAIFNASRNRHLQILRAIPASQRSHDQYSFPHVCERQQGTDPTRHQRACNHAGVHTKGFDGWGLSACCGDPLATAIHTHAQKVATGNIACTQVSLCISRCKFIECQISAVCGSPAGLLGKVQWVQNDLSPCSKFLALIYDFEILTARDI